MNKFSKAISLLCLFFGASQMILLGLIPKVASVTLLPISTVLIIYGLSIFIFLFMTRFWSHRFSCIRPSWIYRIGLWGIFSSFVFLLAAFTVQDPKAAIIFFILARLTHASTASSIMPFSQTVKIETRHGVHQGVLDTTIFLNIGRLLGLAIGGFFSFNSITSLLVLMGMIILSALLRYESSEVKMNLSANEDMLPQGIGAYFLIPLCFTIIVSFFHASIVDIISNLVDGVTKQSALIYSSLGAASVAIVLIQLVLKKLDLMNSPITIMLGSLSYITSFVAFINISNVAMLGVFLILFSIGVAILPISYMGHFYFRFNMIAKQIIAGKISFYQTLGNALGALVAGLIIKAQIQNYILFIFIILVLIGTTVVVNNISEKNNEVVHE